mgnify:CR=1 FL=1
MADACAATLAKLTGRLEPFDVVYASKQRLIMETGMASELNVLAHMLNRIGKGNRRSRDFTLESLRDVITEESSASGTSTALRGRAGWTAEDRCDQSNRLSRAHAWRNPAMESSLIRLLPGDDAGEDEGGAPRPGDRRDGYPGRRNRGARSEVTSR